MVAQSKAKVSTVVIALAAAALFPSGASASTRPVAAFGLDRRQALRRASGAVVGGLAFVEKTVPVFADEDGNPSSLAQEASPVDDTSASTSTTSSLSASATSPQVSEESKPKVESINIDSSDGMQVAATKAEEPMEAKEIIETTTVAEEESVISTSSNEAKKEEDQVSDVAETTHVSQAVVSTEEHETVSAETETSNVLEEKSSKSNAEALEVSETTKSPEVTKATEEASMPMQSESTDTVADEKRPELVAKSNKVAEVSGAVSTSVSIASQDMSSSESITNVAPLEEVSFDQACVADEQKIFAMN